MINRYECIKVNRVPVMRRMFRAIISLLLVTVFIFRQTAAASEGSASAPRLPEQMEPILHRYTWIFMSVASGRGVVPSCSSASNPRQRLVNWHARYAITLPSPWQTIATHLLPPRPGARGEVTKHASERSREQSVHESRAPHINCSDHFRVNLGCFTFNSSQLKQLCTVQNSNSVIYSLACHTKEDILMKIWGVNNIGPHWHSLDGQSFVIN